MVLYSYSTLYLPEWGTLMKLSIDTYVICGDMELEKIIDVAKSNGYVGIEFRAESGQKHGVEPETTKAQRQEIKKKMADAGMATSCISTSVRYESPDRAERAKQIITAKTVVLTQAIFSLCEVARGLCSNRITYRTVETF